MARTIVSFVAPTRGGDATARNRARGWGTARGGGEGRAGVSKAAGGGGFLPGGRRRGSWGRDSGHIAI